MYCNVVNFTSHQNPHKNERDKGSKIPEYSKSMSQAIDLKELAINRDLSGLKRNGSHSNRADSLNLIPDSFNPIKDLDQSEIDHCFERFWVSGIRKVNKKKSKPLFQKYLKDNYSKNWPTIYDLTSKLVKDVKLRIASNQLGFSEMHPTTYLNGERWNDEIQEYSNEKTTINQRNHETPTDRSRRAGEKLRRQQEAYAENDLLVRLDG